jgi:hypothetical protein
VVVGPENVPLEAVDDLLDAFGVIGTCFRELGRTTRERSKNSKRMVATDDN